MMEKLQGESSQKRTSVPFVYVTVQFDEDHCRKEGESN